MPYTLESQEKRAWQPAIEADPKGLKASHRGFIGREEGDIFSVVTKEQSPSLTLMIRKSAPNTKGFCLDLGALCLPPPTPDYLESPLINRRLKTGQCVWA